MAKPLAPTRSARNNLAPETLVSSLAVVLLVNVVQRSVGFGRAVLFCRWLEPEQLGYWEMAYSFLLLAAPLAVLGLPGSFGRYLERYRQRGQLRLFLRRTSFWTFLLAGSTVALLAWRRADLAALVFGSPDRAGLALGVVGCLVVVILHHFFEAIFAGLRMFRVVSAMHFTQSMSFAAVSLTLVACWRAETASVVIGYAVACALSIVGVLSWVALRVRPEAEAGDAVAHRDFWPPLMRFAIWVWVTNLLTNVFGVVDRYMIVHFGGFDTDEALVQVGNYHTSIIVPVLLISFANLLVGAMTPHLSHDWEAGRREAVSGRLNLVLKIGTLVMLSAGVVLLALCPLLFHLAFEDKYDAGLAVMPWTIANCVWFSLLLVAQQYVWCAEKSHRATPPLVVGLVTNIVLNLLLLPTLGLLGAVAATAAATLLTLLTQLYINYRTGMQVHRGTVLVAFAPGLLTLGPTPAAIGVVVLFGLALARGWILTPEERSQIGATAIQRLSRFTTRLGHSAP
ncbi:MurJ-like flippase [Botrimarina colliarenosi]|uniref:MurJ-like flippase n=1 Tax=Botrimarina colliarenosi TaxID=2528001 RepID=A0A5C6A478_9BACT|nr:lipopolysaccharide biosynthesis protein [Botrimarina colliarenosi]TWT94078.1 MurJ-like flippase [Botrimarina colliarenosi]